MDKIFSDLLALMEEEKSLINDLLNIDNNINERSIKYEDIYESFSLILDGNNNISINSDTLFITEGNPLITIAILKNIVKNPSYKYIIYINEGYIGINEWLVTNFKKILPIDVTLDTDVNYNKYIGNKSIKVIPLGEQALVDAVLDDFK